MPAKRRATKAHDRGRFPEFCDRQLLEGPDLLIAGAGYFDLVQSKPAYLDQAEPGEREIILSAMRFDWQRKRDRLLSAWNGPGQPWAQNAFDDDAPEGGSNG